LQDELEQKHKELAAKVMENQDLKQQIDLLHLQMELTQAGPSTGGGGFVFTQ
jgi:hypothetical protein